MRDSGGSLVGENNVVFTTNDNGDFTIAGLTPGVTISATQTESVSGYVLDETPKSVLITATQEKIKNIRHEHNAAAVVGHSAPPQIYPLQNALKRL